MTALTYSNEILILAAVAVGLTRYNKLTRPFKILALSTISTLVVAILSDIFDARYKNNAPVLHYEAVSQFIFYALVYYRLFTNQKTKTVIAISIVIISIFSVINARWLQPFHTVFPTYVNLPAFGILVIFSLLLFKQMLLSPLVTPILKQGVFWFNTAIIFYSTTMFLNIGLSNVYVRNPTIDLLIYYFWYAILDIFIILIGVALLTDNKKNTMVHAV